MEAPAAGDGTILTESILVVRQEWGAPLTRPTYRVLDRRWNEVARAHYVAKDEVSRLTQGCRRGRRGAAALQVVDASGTVAFTVIFPGSRARSVMFVRDGAGNDIGEVIKTNGFRKLRYDVRHESRHIGTILTNRRQSAASIMDDLGTEVATIQNLTAAAPFPVPSNDGYFLQAHQPLQEPLRSLVVAAAVTLQAATGGETAPGEYTAIQMRIIPRRFDPLRRKL